MKQIGKKACILLIAGVMFLMGLSGCESSNENTFSKMSEGQSDLEYVQSKGTLVVGITEFAPMDFLDGDQWTGFDADLVRDFAESIGVTVEFKEIDWDNRTKLLENGSIDCIWNGMTMTEEMQSTISCSEPYLSNAQVAVMERDEMEQYQTIDACRHMLFAAEKSSTGETLLKEMKYRYTTFDTQLEALQSVRSGKADAAMIDIVMAAYYTSEEQEFQDLSFQIALNDEKSCAGFRKGSDLTEKANEFLKNAYEDGTIDSLASRYGLENAVLDKK